jgi:hypothetical protein
MPKSVSETEARFAVLEVRIKAIESFLEVTGGYSIIKGQGLGDEFKRKQELKLQRTKERLEKEALPPLINIHSVKRRFDGTGILAQFENLRQEGARPGRSAAISKEAADRLRQGDTSEFHWIQLSREPCIVFATTSEVKDLPQKYEARIVTDQPIEVQLDEDAFEEF